MQLLGETAAFTAAIFVMLVGLAGVVLPVVPGLVLIWLGALIFALAEGFGSIDPLAFAALSLLAVLGISADIWMTQLGARVGGAEPRSRLVGLLGGVAGAALLFFLGGVTAGLGLVIGSIAGVFGAEWHRQRDWKGAFRAGGGWLLGWLASTLFQFLVGILMIALFLWQAFRG